MPSSSRLHARAADAAEKEAVPPRPEDAAGPPGGHDGWTSSDEEAPEDPATVTETQVTGRAAHLFCFLNKLSEVRINREEYT